MKFARCRTSLTCRHSPINGLWKKVCQRFWRTFPQSSLEFADYHFSEETKYSQEECKERETTYATSLTVKVRLINRETGEIKEQDVFMGEFPLMTEKGTFIYNGAARAIVTQLVRNPGP